MMSHRTRYLDGCGSVVKSMKKCVRRESGVAIPETAHNFCRKRFSFTFSKRSEEIDSRRERERFDSVCVCVCHTDLE